MTDEEANAKMDKATAVLKEEFPDCLFMVFALTDDQSALRYVSNLDREEAREMALEILDRPDCPGFKNEDGETLN